MFESLADIVDVDVQSVVERCLARLQQPDRKMARLDAETEEFWIDGDGRLHRIELARQ